MSKQDAMPTVPPQGHLTAAVHCCSSNRAGASTTCPAAHPCGQPLHLACHCYQSSGSTFPSVPAVEALAEGCCTLSKGALGSREAPTARVWPPRPPCQQSHPEHPSVLNKEPFASHMHLHLWLAAPL